MGWIRVSDDFYDNNKMIAAGSIGRDLYWHGMAYCNRNLTDGLIPRGRALSLVDFTGAAVLVNNFGGVDGQDCAPVALERVLDAELWHEDGHDCPECVQPGPNHFIIHDYLKYQPSRAEIEAKRSELHEVRAAAGRMGGLRSGEVRRSNEATKQNPKQNGSKTEAPNPNPNTSLVDLGGEVTQVSAVAPPPICTSHTNDPERPCRKCKRRREWEERHAEEHAKAAKQHRRQRHEAAARVQLDCPECDEYGWLNDVEPPKRCSLHPIVKPEAV